MLPRPQFTQIHLQQEKRSLIYLDKHYADFFKTTNNGILCNTAVPITSLQRKYRRDTAR